MAIERFNPGTHWPTNPLGGVTGGNQTEGAGSVAGSSGSEVALPPATTSDNRREMLEGLATGNVPSIEQLQTAYDAVNWDHPDTMQVLQLLHMISSKLKSISNEAKWAEAHTQISSLLSEAKNMESAASTRMWTSIGTSMATVAISSVNLVASVKNLKEISTLAGKDGLVGMDKTKFDQVSQQIQYLNSKLQVTKLKGDVAEGLVKGMGAMSNYNAEMDDAAAKKDSAQATARGANQQEMQSAESNQDEAIRKLRDMIQEFLQNQRSAEAGIVRNF